MSYAIIINAKYKRENLMAVYRHDERKNKHYSNKDIDKTKSHLNYSLKDSEFNYVKEFVLIGILAVEYLMLVSVLLYIYKIEEQDKIYKT